MRSDLLSALKALPDRELESRVRELSADERGATALLVAHLAELDTRDVHLRAGHGSLFAYCRDALGLAEQEAYNRIAAARTARRLPLVLDLLASGSIHLTAVRMLGPHLTPENHRRVLEQARGRTKLQLEEIAAALCPQADAASFVRKLPSRSPAAAAASAGAAPAVRAGGIPAAVPGAESATEAGGVSVPAPLPRRPADVTPLAPDRYRVQVTIGGETLEKLRLAKDLLRHAVPSGDEAVILDRALSALLIHLARQRFAAAGTARPSPGTAPGSRHIPAEVRRAVWLRDGDRCAFVSPGGRRCSERAFLEFHHVVPYSQGGEASVANIQLRCRSHNAYEARLFFGAHAGNGNAHDTGPASGRGAGSVRERRAVYTVSPSSRCRL